MLFVCQPLIIDLLLRRNFPVVLQNPHVITKEHVFVGVVTRGPDGNSLNSRFDNRSTEGYQNSLGNAIGMSVLHYPCVYVCVCTCCASTCVGLCTYMYAHPYAPMYSKYRQVPETMMPQVRSVYEYLSWPKSCLICPPPSSKLCTYCPPRSAGVLPVIHCNG